MVLFEYIRSLLYMLWPAGLERWDILDPISISQESLLHFLLLLLFLNEEIIFILVICATRGLEN